MTFPGLHAPKRTDKAFRSNAYSNHCKAVTPLLKLDEFDIIEDIIVADKLHLIDLGVHKRLVLGWRNGSLGRKRLTDVQIDQICAALQQIPLPSEIHRKIRPLKYAHYWKGSESATFLNYVGFVVLKPHLPDDVYKHYMLLFCAVTLLSSNVYKDKWQLAGQLLDKFVADYGKVYHEKYIGSNVHNLQHVYEEVQKLGPLPSISTYPFENHLYHLKKLLRSGWKELQQAINRLTELDEFHVAKKTPKTRFPRVSKRGNTITVFIHEDFVMQNTFKNSWFLTKDDRIFKFEDVNDANNLSGREVKLKGLAFDDPFESSVLNISKGCSTTLTKSCKDVSIEHIKCKLVAVPTSKKNEIIFVPLLHTLEE